MNTKTKNEILKMINKLGCSLQANINKVDRRIEEIDWREKHISVIEKQNKILAQELKNTKETNLKCPCCGR